MNLQRRFNWQAEASRSWECLHDLRVLIAVRLHGIDERDLRLGAWTERFDNRHEALCNIQMANGMVSKGRRTETLIRARPSIWSGVRSSPPEPNTLPEPEAPDKFSLGERTLLNSCLHSSDDLQPKKKKEI
jgi:hypothetical protein